MNAFHFYTKAYGYTRNYRGVPVWFLTPIRRVIRNVAARRLPKFFSSVPANIYRRRNEDVVVSLTSFPARICFVFMTIESLLRQTMLPGKILLWLSKDQFPTEDSLPVRLRHLQNEVFSIRYVDGDIRSHKKYYYSFQEFPEKTIITVDDDIIYPPLLVEQLVGISKSFPNCVVANVARKLSYHDGKLNNYKTWKNASPFDKNDIVQIGFGGVLYPPNCLFEDCLKLELSQKLAPSVDDLWLNAMARLQGTCVVKTPHNKSFLPIVIPNNQTLTSVNNGQSRNDVQLKQIRDYYANTKYCDPYIKHLNLE